MSKRVNVLSFKQRLFEKWVFNYELLSNFNKKSNVLFKNILIKNYIKFIINKLLSSFFFKSYSYDLNIKQFNCFYNIKIFITENYNEFFYYNIYLFYKYWYFFFKYNFCKKLNNSSYNSNSNKIFLRLHINYNICNIFFNYVFFKWLSIKNIYEFFYINTSNIYNIVNINNTASKIKNKNIIFYNNYCNLFKLKKLFNYYPEDVFYKIYFYEFFYFLKLYYYFMYFYSTNILKQFQKNFFNKITIFINLYKFYRNVITFYEYNIFFYNNYIRKFFTSFYFINNFININILIKKFAFFQYNYTTFFNSEGMTYKNKKNYNILSSIIKSLIISLFTKNCKFFTFIVKSYMYLWKKRYYKFFNLLKTIIKLFWYNRTFFSSYTLLDVKGIRILLKGKVKYKPRKGKFFYQCGKLYKSTLFYTTNYNFVPVYNKTGIFGFHIWITF